MLIKQTDYKYVERNVSRHGKPRFYFRAPGQKRVRLPDPYIDPNGFIAEHHSLLRESGPDASFRPPLRRKEAAVPLTAHIGVSPRSFEGIVWQARSRARRKGVPFELNVSWAHRTFHEQAGRCAVSGIDMEMPSKGMKQSPYQVSIDRVRSSLGYTEDNCRLVILAVNLAMNIWGEAAFKKLAHRIAAESLLKAI